MWTLRRDDATATLDRDVRWDQRETARDPSGSLPPAIEAAAPAAVELIGTHLRVGGLAELGRFRRLTDYVNLLDGFFPLQDALLLTRTGGATRIAMPGLRVRLDDVAIVGQLDAEPLRAPAEAGLYVAKRPTRLVVMTRAHLIYGQVFIHESASLMAFVDSPDPKFIPMTNVRVRWISDRRLAARYPFALIQRALIQGVATEGTTRSAGARARRAAAVAEADRRTAAAVEF